MTRPKIVTAEACAWCDEPRQGHAQHWHPVGGWHRWAAPSRGLIAARMRRRFQINGLLPTDPNDPAHQATLGTEQHPAGGS